MRQNPSVNLHHRLVLVLFVGRHEALLQRLVTLAFLRLELARLDGRLLRRQHVLNFWLIQQELLRAGVLLVSISVSICVTFPGALRKRFCGVSLGTLAAHFVSYCLVFLIICGRHVKSEKPFKTRGYFYFSRSQGIRKGAYSNVLPDFCEASLSSFVNSSIFGVTLGPHGGNMCSFFVRLGAT